MNMNFNIGKNTNKINTDIDTTPKTSSNNNDAKKKMFKFMGIITGGIILLLLIIFILSLFIKKEYSYEEIEIVLQEAAESYFQDHKSSLPKSKDQIVEIDSTNLVTEKKMKDLSEYTKKGVSCTGRVQVQKANSSYLYTPYLNCGDNYITKELYQVVAKESNIVTSGYGLYNQNGTYIFRGENVNNYVQLDKSLWRIVKITSDNNIVLIKDESLDQSLAWDDRYNEETGYASGINNYSASRIKDQLDLLYKNTESKEYEFLSANDKTKLVSYNACIGKRSVEETGSGNTTECSQVLKSQKVGLLTLSDYMNASIDTNCKSAESLSCQNYNYLVTDYDWWLITANNKDTTEVYSINTNGHIENVNASNYANIRPVIYLNNKILYKSGKGTKSKPYTIK